MNTHFIPTHNLANPMGVEISFEYNELTKKQNYDPLHFHRHSYYEIFFFEKGGGKHQIDFNEFEVLDFSVHIVSPGQIHMLQRELDTFGHVILFSKSFYELNGAFHHPLQFFPFANNNTEKPIIQIPEDERMIFLNYFQNIQRASKYISADKDTLICAHLHTLLLELKHLFEIENPNQIQNNEFDFIKKFRNALENNFMKFHKPADYAELLSTTVVNLNEKIKKTLGNTASQLINERLLLEAKRMLLFNDLNVNEIAYQLNFEDASYFNRFFKQHNQNTPKEYRKILRDKYLIG